VLFYLLTHSPWSNIWHDLFQLLLLFAKTDVRALNWVITLNWQYLTFIAWMNLSFQDLEVIQMGSWQVRRSQTIISQSLAKARSLCTEREQEGMENPELPIEKCVASLLLVYQQEPQLNLSLLDICFHLSDTPNF
jgi:hypothetical protein